MSSKKRQESLLAMVRQAGSMRIQDLAHHYDVSLETIRRDIRPLTESEDLIKSHGMVTASRPTSEIPFDRRMRQNEAEKWLIGHHVAQSINDGDSVMMDTGTTSSYLARALLDKHALTIVTNSSDVGRTLATVNGNKVYLAGGEMMGDNGGAFGRSAIEFIANFKVEHAIITIGGIDATTGLSDFNLFEAELGAKVLTCGRRRVVISDHTKFNTSALVRVGGFNDIDLLVSNAEPPPDIAEQLEAAGTRFELAQ